MAIENQTSVLSASPAELDVSRPLRSHLAFWHRRCENIGLKTHRQLGHRTETRARCRVANFWRSGYPAIFFWTSPTFIVCRRKRITCWSSAMTPSRGGMHQKLSPMHLYPSIPWPRVSSIAPTSSREWRCVEQLDSCHLHIELTYL
jgi:hypothetical protein